jgi:cell division protease FtsH
MVTQYGMTERLGAVKLGSGDAEPFLGRDIGHGRDYSENLAAVVDQEVSRLIGNAHQEAFDILNENREVLDNLVRALFERETLDRAEVAEVFKPLKLWPRRPAWTGSDSRVPSSLPPVSPPPALNGHRTNGHQPPNGSDTPAGGAQLPPGHQPVPPELPGQPGAGVPGQLPPGSVLPPSPQPPAGGSQPRPPGITDAGEPWPPKGPDFR